ncbi:MAG: hypothetical protein KDK66_04710 [Deltaproteobacteria bacterium]|nr:hypothetical protein [Deltaproteobacteria bacterium]
MNTYLILKTFLCLALLLVISCGSLPKKVKTSQGECLSCEPNWCWEGDKYCTVDEKGCKVCGCPNAKGSAKGGDNQGFRP